MRPTWSRSSCVRRLASSASESTLEDDCSWRMLPSKSVASFKRSAARRASASLCCGEVARRMSSVAWRKRSSDCCTRGSPDFPDAPDCPPEPDCPAEADCPDEPDCPPDPDCPEEPDDELPCELPCCEPDCEPELFWPLLRAICSIWRCSSSAWRRSISCCQRCSELCALFFCCCASSSWRRASWSSFCKASSISFCCWLAEPAV